MGKWVIVLLVVLSATGCDTLKRDSAKDIIRVDGSSTVYPIVNAGAKAFQRSESGKDILVDFSGTSRGLQKFCAGDIQIANASRKISEAERAYCHEMSTSYLEIPIALDGIAVVVHANSIWVDYLTVAELKQIWHARSEGVVEHWNDIRREWPDSRITLYGPGSASGTYGYFAQAVLGDQNMRGDYVATEDDEMLVEGISSDPSGIAFFGLGYYRGHNYSLKLVPIAQRNVLAVQGEPVIPSVETVKRGLYQPLSRQMYLYVSEASLQEEGVARFIDFLLQRAGKIVEETGYVPQSQDVYNQVRQHIAGIIDDG